MPFLATAHALTGNARPIRDSIGGHAFLPADVPWPLCPKSGKPMVLFFQFDIRPEFKLSIAPGSHLAVFMSPDVNEIHTFDFLPDDAPLPARFWEQRLRHFKVFLFGPEVPLVPSPEPDGYLIHHRIEFAPAGEDSSPFLQIGGEPRWYQDPESHPGFDFVCQLFEDYPFPKLPHAPKQPNSFSSRAYCLFLGNSAYFFARAQPTHPEEVYIVLQN